ncbi:MAG: hypothetical protein JO188_10805 [Hyphomicrobiales bacterium]|nr:hypothetical protein [Hyphomicrobiales bacterium]
MLKQSIGAALFAAAGLTGSSLAAQAQDAREAEILGYHQLCDHGDRRACVRFGMFLQQNQDRAMAWRRMHPEWFWWER